MCLCCPPRDEALPLFFILSFLSAESSDLSLSSTHLNVGVIAGSVVGILFILGCIAAFIGVNLAVCLYIVVKSKRRSNLTPPNVTTESRPILMSSIEDEVDRPSDTMPPVSEERRGEEEKTEAAKEKERETMEEEQRYQPQEAIIGAPSTEQVANGNI